ncbi:MAG: NADH-quinone oxidoreductase subunit NuoK [Deltaproteobacteria bacterium]|nr:NADH-quinone oxidoreductase subunit NuoK [Deltaproteobacteria bacterium]
MNLQPEPIIVATAVFIFCCGAAGVALRKNPIGLLMSVELMINAAILVLVLGSRVHGNPMGQTVALLVLVLGAAEAVVGLALALAVFRRRAVVDVDAPQEIRG